jgi:hypothetical protein
MNKSQTWRTGNWGRKFRLMRNQSGGKSDFGRKIRLDLIGQRDWERRGEEWRGVETSGEKKSRGFLCQSSSQRHQSIPSDYNSQGLWNKSHNGDKSQTEIKFGAKFRLGNKVRPVRKSN